MPYDKNFDDEISLIVGLDRNGIPRTVVQPNGSGEHIVECVDQELIDSPIPRDTFFDGELQNIDLLKLEPLTAFVIRRPGVGANGSTQTCIYVRGQKYPRP